MSLSSFPEKSTATTAHRQHRVKADILETMKAELDECIELLRPHYPEENDDMLRQRAMFWRPVRYQKGSWPTAEEIEGKKAKEKIDREDSARLGVIAAKLAPGA